MRHNSDIPKMGAYDRLWSAVKFGPECWTFEGTKNQRGYGRVSEGERWRAVHRFVVEEETGLDLTGLVVMHKCDNPSCVRLDHLRVGTQADNMRDMYKKRRDAGSKKTHCSQGHPFDDENTFVASRGERRCRTCNRNWNREARAARGRVKGTAQCSPPSR